METLVRCGACQEPPAPGTTLRRGRCTRCYDYWVRARPVGSGARCASCEERRVARLRHYEVGLGVNAPGGRWVILCHNCAAAADRLAPPPRSIEALKMRLARDRRWGDRRAAAVGRARPWDAEDERRLGDRRGPVIEIQDNELLDGLLDDGDRALLDGIVADLDGVIIELEADYEPADAASAASDEVTAIHARPLAE